MYSKSDDNTSELVSLSDKADNNFSAASKRSESLWDARSQKNGRIFSDILAKHCQTTSVCVEKNKKRCYIINFTSLDHQQSEDTQAKHETTSKEIDKVFVSNQKKNPPQASKIRSFGIINAMATLLHGVPTPAPRHREVSGASRSSRKIVPGCGQAAPQEFDTLILITIFLFVSRLNLEVAEADSRFRLKFF